MSAEEVSFGSQEWDALVAIGDNTPAAQPVCPVPLASSSLGALQLEIVLMVQTTVVARVLTARLRMEPAVQTTVVVQA